MPKDNIQRAIDRGTGAGSGDEQIERVVYEGYGPGGAAILVEALTDNRNRTGSEVRNAFDSHGGNLGEPGSVAWQFEKKGVILVDGERYSEDDLIGAIDAGAEDVAPDGDVLKVTTEPADLAAVRAALEADGVEVESAELAMEPNAVVEIDRGERGPGAGAADGGARRPRRRRGRARELRHPRGAARAGRGVEPPQTLRGSRSVASCVEASIARWRCAPIADRSPSRLARSRIARRSRSSDV